MDVRSDFMPTGRKRKIEIFRDMSDLMPGFKRLMDTAGHEGIQQLCTQYEGLYQYAKILESIAEGIHSGKIKVPK